MTEKETGLVEHLRKAEGVGRWTKAMHTAADLLETKDATIERLQAELSALTLEKQMRQMAETRNAELLAELAECQQQREHYRECMYQIGADAAKQLTQNTALALRVKALRATLLKIENYNRALTAEQIDEIALEALSTSDRTSEEVIAEFLGEPVVCVTSSNFCQCDNQKLYAPKVKP